MFIHIYIFIYRLLSKVTLRHKERAVQVYIEFCIFTCPVLDSAQCGRRLNCSCVPVVTRAGAVRTVRNHPCTTLLSCANSTPFFFKELLFRHPSHILTYISLSLASSFSPNKGSAAVLLVSFLCSQVRALGTAAARLAALASFEELLPWIDDAMK